MISSPLKTHSSRKTEECPELGAYHLINTDTGEVVPLPCNRYACDVCGPRKSYKLQKHLQNQFECYDYVRLFTFTVRSTRFHNPRHAVIRMREIWRRFLNNIRRDKSLSKKLRNFQYVRVTEFHKSGYPHFHVLSTCYMPQKILWRHWNHAVNVVMNVSGYNASVNAKGMLSSKSAAKYVCKYVLKSAREFDEKIGKYYNYNRCKFKLYTKSGELKLFYPKCPIHLWVFEIINPDLGQDCLTSIPYSQHPEKLLAFYENLPPPDLVEQNLVADNFPSLENDKNYFESLISTN